VKNEIFSYFSCRSHRFWSRFAGRGVGNGFLLVSVALLNDSEMGFAYRTVGPTLFSRRCCACSIKLYVDFPWYGVNVTFSANVPSPGWTKFWLIKLVNVPANIKVPKHCFLTELRSDRVFVECQMGNSLQFQQNRNPSRH